MTLRFDWKFWVVLAATLASVLVPVWLWRADLSGRSLHFQLISQTALKPPDSAKTLDLRVSVAGTELLTPYLTVFELTNDGTRPVPSTDFESPVEIVTTNKAVIVRASVTAAKPTDLAATLLTEDGKTIIRPLLFNPGDSLTIAVLTTGDAPTFKSRARIAGVQSVPIIDTRSSSPSPVRSGIVVAAALLFTVSASIVVGGWPSAGIRLRPRSAFLIFIVTGVGAAFLFMVALEALGIDGFLPLVGFFLASLLFASFISAWLNRPEPTSGERSKGATSNLPPVNSTTSKIADV